MAPATRPKDFRISGRSIQHSFLGHSSLKKNSLAWVQKGGRARLDRCDIQVILGSCVFGLRCALSWPVTRAALEPYKGETKESAIEPKDEDLLTNWFHGDARAFGVFYERHRGRVFRWLVSKGLSPGDADEVTQEVFLNLHSRVGGYDPSRPALPWTFSVVRSTWLDWLRRESRLKNRSEAWASERALLGDEEEGGEITPEGRLAGEDTSRLVEVALSKLPASSRTLLESRFVAELPYESIAKETGKSPAALRKAVERSLGTLRAYFSGKGKKA